MRISDWSSDVCSSDLVAMIGHSQGVTVPRWALKWWPSARDAVDDFVMEAGPNHGTTAVGSLPALVPQLTAGMVGLPEVFYQFSPDSNFVAALNADDETPGDISYTRSEEPTSELPSLMRISYAVFCLKKKNNL